MMKKLFYLIVCSLVLFSCSSNQSKAESKVKETITKFSTYPDTYEPIEFLDLKTKDSISMGVRYELGHMYRIRCRDGVQRVMNHTFTIQKYNHSDDFFVEIVPFEYWD